MEVWNFQFKALVWRRCGPSHSRAPIPRRGSSWNQPGRVPTSSIRRLGTGSASPLERWPMTLPVPIPWRRVRVMTSRKTNPVGTTWNPALRDGVADPDPYNGIDYGKYLCGTSSGFLRTILGKSLNPATCTPRLGEFVRVERSVGGCRAGLSQTEACRIERLCAPPQAAGTRHDT